MVKKFALVASAAVLVLGVGTAARAASGGTSSSPGASAAEGKPAPPGAPGASTAPGRPDERGPDPMELEHGPKGLGHGPKGLGHGKGHQRELRALGRALHAQWVTRDRDNENAFVTHDAIRGEVTAVSASSITVKAADGFSQTYAVTGSTKVRLRTAHPGAGKRGAIADVHRGDKVAVLGTGTSSLVAEHILDATD